MIGAVSRLIGIFYRQDQAGMALRPVSGAADEAALKTGGAQASGGVQAPTADSSVDEDGEKAGKSGRTWEPDFDTYECQTCKNRKYKDGSDDPGVSFKTATRVSPERAAFAVRSHEMEHVGRERAKAQREDREVVSQSVTYQTGICPECGRVYVSGGTTRTVTKGQADGAADSFQGEVVKGKYLDLAA